MAYEIARDLTPYRALTGRDFVWTWPLELEDGAGVVTPEDLSDVTSAEVAIQLQVSRGVTRPAAIRYTTGGGAVTISGNAVTLTVDKAATANWAVGAYDLQINLDRAGGRDEAVLEGVLQVAAGVGG